MNQLAQLMVQLLSDFTVSKVLCQVSKYPDSTIPKKKKGRARATNLLFEKIISWQDIGLENYV